MKAAVLRRYGDNRMIDVADVSLPPVSDTELLVEVRSASVNPLDVKTRDGKVRILLKYHLPLVLGNDLAGVVRQVGKQVRRFKVGDEIYARLDKSRIGSFAEFVAVRESDAALRPKNTTFEEAASLPLVALTAWQALVEIGKLQAGQRVLVHAGSGGVGTVAIQIARHLGAEVFTTVGHRNFDLAKRLGADTLIDYRTERFEDVAKNCDVVLDSAGGDTLVRSFQCVKPGGVVVSIGDTPSAAFAKQWGLNSLLVFIIGWMSRKVSAAARASKARYEYLFMRPDGDQLERIAGLVERGIIKPQIDKVFALEQVREALSYSESGRATGKVVVKVS
ncbi:MAG: NADP-dependent oxidoreductase [Leptothrix ochracea]|jgi:NADPH:quinone reductase-like Zn-dependent oxidoreductase|uniref:NADP-dependent oxidoreductase n=1 Tax=Leptothrix ochracea TaxID=735331 RepID=UPI0034E29F46